MAKKKLSTAIEEESNELTLTFGDTDSTQMVCGLSEYSEEMRDKLALHGLKQKLSDSIAGIKEDFPKMIETITKVNQTLLNNDWKIAREGGGGGIKTTLLAKAIARIQGIEEEAAKLWLDDQDDDAKKVLRAHGEVKAVMAEIKAEEAKAAASNVDPEDSLQSLLGGLNV